MGIEDTLKRLIESSPLIISSFNQGALYGLRTWRHVSVSAHAPVTATYAWWKRQASHPSVRPGWGTPWWIGTLGPYVQVNQRTSLLKAPLTLAGKSNPVAWLDRKSTRLNSS